MLNTQQISLSCSSFLIVHSIHIFHLTPSPSVHTFLNSQSHVAPETLPEKEHVRGQDIHYLYLIYVSIITSNF